MNRISIEKERRITLYSCWSYYVRLQSTTVICDYNVRTSTTQHNWTYENRKKYATKTKKSALRISQANCCVFFLFAVVSFSQRTTHNFKNFSFVCLWVCGWIFLLSFLAHHTVNGAGFVYVKSRSWKIYTPSSSSFRLYVIFTLSTRPDYIFTVLLYAYKYFFFYAYSHYMYCIALDSQLHKKNY